MVTKRFGPSRRRWAEEEDAALVASAAVHGAVQVRAMADQLDRAVEAIQTRARRLRLPYSLAVSAKRRDVGCVGGGGERGLWCAVLGHAFADATGTAKWRGGEHRNATVEDDRRYLTTPSRDLQEVCDLAGVDWRFIIRKSRELFGNE